MQKQTKADKIFQASDIVDILGVFLEKLYVGGPGNVKLTTQIDDDTIEVTLEDSTSWVKASYEEIYNLWFVVGSRLDSTDLVEYNPERTPRKVAESIFALFMRQKTADVYSIYGLGDNQE